LEERTVPSFAATTYPAGAGPAFVATGHFQSSTSVDFAVANIQGNTVSVFLNNNDGSGTFQPGVSYPAGPAPVELATGDLNGDGLDDIVVSNVSSPGMVTVLLNNTFFPGTFSSGETFALRQNGPRDIRLADMNGDGFLDIVTANYNSNSVSVLLGNGDGTFQTARPYLAGTQAGTYALAIGDFYGDGFPSVAVGNPAANEVTILRNNGDGSLKGFQQVATPGLVTGLAAGSLRPGGPVDLVAANNNTQTITVLLNDGAGNFSPTTYPMPADARTPLRVTLADVNGDGNLDVITSNFLSTAPGNISIFLGNGDGTLQAPNTVNSGGNQPAGVAVGDVEGDIGTDGRSDLIVANFGSANVTVLVNTPAPIIVSTTLSGTFNNQTVSDGQVVFSDPIDPNTFTPNQVMITDPNGNPVNVTGIFPLDGTNTRFDVTFDPQSTLGSYSVTIGPNILDPTDTYAVPVFHSTFAITNNLIVNGGFETGDFTGWTTMAAPLGSLFGVETGNQHSGTHDAFFGGTTEDSFDMIWQDVPTNPGSTYLISFWVRNDAAGVCELVASWGGQQLVDLEDANAFPYTQFTFTMTATSSTTRLEFDGYQVPSYFRLDDVVVSPTAAPAPHGSTGGTHLGAATLAGGIAAGPTQGPAQAPVGGSGLGSFPAPSQQASAPVAVGGQTAVASSGAHASTVNPALLTTAQKAEASGYHVAATSAVFSDPLVGDLFQNAL
jgi:hypothetical protein